MREVRIVLPPPGKQVRSSNKQILKQLDKRLAELDSLLARIREAIERLKEFRTALISAAVTGKIDVRAA